MISDEIKNIIIPHLGDKLAHGSAILFTGAGFSMDCQNYIPEQLPSGYALRQPLWEIAFPGQTLTDGSLADIFAAAQLRNPRKLTEILRRTFTINPTTIPTYYGKIYAAPWSRIYTLNIDDLAGAVNIAFQLPRRVVQISATTSDFTAAANGAMGGVLEQIHLNGVLDDLPNNVTFAPMQYAQRTAIPDAWYASLTSQLLSHVVIFIGSKLDEAPLWQHIQLRRMKGGRGTREMRPRSYLITPSLDAAKQALLEEFNVIWIKATGEEFADEILSELQPQCTAGLEKFKVQASRYSVLPEVSDLAINPNQNSDFLLGSEPVWADIQSGRAIERDHDIHVLATANAALNTPDPGCLVITGTSGSGKSAALMRLALRLSADGVRVAWLDKDTDMSPREIRVAMKKTGAPKVLAIDDADLFGHDLSKLCFDVASAEQRPFIIMAIRSGKVDRVAGDLSQGGIAYFETAVPHLTDSDIGALIDVLDKNNRLGHLKGLPRSDQYASFTRNAGRQLLVAMLAATSGDPFREKPITELRELPSEGREAYALICIASTFRFSLSRAQILMALGATSNTALNAIDALSARHIVTVKPNGTIRARHRVIAELVFDELQRTGELRSSLEGLTFMAATEVNPGLHRSARPWRVLRALINHEFLNRTIFGNVSSIYAPLESLLSWDAQYWLQRGSWEVEYGSLPHAENFLSQARSLSPDERLIKTEWAFLLFRKASEKPSALESPALVKEAFTILEGIIRDHGATDSYPYHILGSQGLAWARRCPMATMERQLFLESILFHLDRAKSLFPRRTEIQQLWTDVKREHLSITVSPSS